MTAPKGSRTLRLGVAGLGTVGGGLLKLIERQDELRLPGRLVVTAEQPVDDAAVIAAVDEAGYDLVG